MSWTHWFCPPQQQEHPQTRRAREDLEERQRLAESGRVPVSGEYWKVTGDRGKWLDAFRKGTRSDVRYMEVIVSMPTFLGQVAHIEFSQLRSLYLENCGIVSLEDVVRLKAPQLANLDLRNNRISEIRSLRKMGCRLDHLFLAGNPIRDYNALPLIHFHRKLQTTYVTNFSGNYTAVINDLGPFFKAEPLHVMDHLFIQQVITLAGKVREDALFAK